MGYPPRVRVWVHRRYNKADPQQKPVPAWQVRVLMGTGTGTAKNTRGLPVQNTTVRGDGQFRPMRKLLAFICAGSQPPKL